LSIHGEGQGTKVKVFNDTVSELDITYMLNRNWRVELILGTIPSEKNVVSPGRCHRNQSVATYSNVAISLFA